MLGDAYSCVFSINYQLIKCVLIIIIWLSYASMIVRCRYSSLVSIIKSNLCQELIKRWDSERELFLPQHRTCTCRGHRLRPLNDFLISTRNLRDLPSTQATYPSSNRVSTGTRPSNPLRSTMDAPIATRNSSGDMGVGNYSLKSRLLPPLLLPK